MICPLYEISKHCSKKIFLHDDSQKWTYGEWNKQAQGIASWIKKNTVVEGSRIAIYNRSAFSTTSWLMACARTKTILVILSNKETEQTIANLRSKFSLDHLIDPSFQDPKPLEVTNSCYIDPEAPLTMLFTSGSTGLPKAVIHSFQNHWSSARFSNQNIEFKEDQNWLLSLYLWHIGGLSIIFRTLFGKAKTTVKSSSKNIAYHLKNYSITHLSLVAVQLSELLISRTIFPNLKAVLVGGGPIPPDLIHQAVKAQIPIHCTYGMTELCSQLTTTAPNASPKELKSAGSPLGDWNVLISADGEICVRGSPLFLGYWNGSTITPALSLDGYFHTNDIGYIEDEHLFPTGRKDQMFISGGENIHPEEIEKVLGAFVDLAIVVPIPDERYGSRPVAFLKGSWRLEEIVKHLNDTLPSFKHPDYFLQWPDSISAKKASRSALQHLAFSMLCQ